MGNWISESEYKESMKESPARALEILIKKMNDIPDLIRDAQTAQQTAEVIESLAYIRRHYLKDVIEDLEHVKGLQTACLPNMLDIDAVGALWES